MVWARRSPPVSPRVVATSFRTQNSTVMWGSLRITNRAGESDSPGSAGPYVVEDIVLPREFCVSVCSSGTTGYQRMRASSQAVTEHRSPLRCREPLRCRALPTTAEKPLRASEKLLKAQVPLTFSGQPHKVCEIHTGTAHSGRHTGTQLIAGITRRVCAAYRSKGSRCEPR